MFLKMKLNKSRESNTNTLNNPQN